MKAILLTCVLCVLLPVQMACAHEKTRLIIMADMGNEPDEEQQMVHMLMYSNMFDLEGLIACSGKYLHDGKNGFKGKTHPELFHKLIDGYETVVGNLRKHASGWPEADYLRQHCQGRHRPIRHRRCGGRKFHRCLQADRGGHSQR